MFDLSFDNFIENYFQSWTVWYLRYAVVISPLNNPYMTDKRAIMKTTQRNILIIWIIGMLMATPCLYLYKFKYIPSVKEGIKPYCTTHENTYIGLTFSKDIRRCKVNCMIHTSDLTPHNFREKDFSDFQYFGLWFTGKSAGLNRNDQIVSCFKIASQLPLPI